MVNDELAQRLAEALGKLRPEERLVLQFRYVDGLEIKEIAKLLGYKRHQIVYRIILGKNKLLKYFKIRGLALDDFV
jgi:RNA polymerase sigma factor (sigma-70 family)